MKQKQKNTNKIALVGNRGVGKSSIAKLTSFFANLSYVSTDILVRYENQLETTQNIIKKLGWQHFRETEKKVLEKVAQFENVILDCGGGIIVNTNSQKEIFCHNKAKLLDNFYIIYIHASSTWLLSHQKVDSNRPKYTTNVQTIIENREKWYQKIADHTIDRKNLDSTIVALKIYEHIIGLHHSNN